MLLAQKTPFEQPRLAAVESVTVGGHRYRILEKGIRGEMGQTGNHVCRAVRIISSPHEQPERHDGEFVIKTTPGDQLVGRNAAIRLRRQHREIAADVLAQFECDEVERPGNLTVTRLIPGTSLERKKRDERLRDADRETVFAVSWRIALAILDTLEPLEAAELIHRDIKAANIIDRGKELGLTDVDFLTTREQVKQTGDRHSAVGTPTTMTPEMMTDSHRIDHTTDPYGGACTVYGFMGGRLGADTIDEIANERIWGWFIQRIEREFKEIADHCPERAKLPFHRLRTWLTHALAQFPSRRPQTIHEHRELLWDTPNSSMV